jgi:hypothetical protein
MNYKSTGIKEERNVIIFKELAGEIRLVIYTYRLENKFWYTTTGLHA